jgi:hypothetical protein
MTEMGTRGQPGRSRRRISAAMATLFGWGGERMRQRQAVLREQEMELQIARLRAVGGF